MPINASQNKNSKKSKLKQDTSELSIKEYAEHHEVSVVAVRKAIKTGRITLNQNKKLNPKLADAEWFENTNPLIASFDMISHNTLLFGELFYHVLYP